MSLLGAIRIPSERELIYREILKQGPSSAQLYGAAHPLDELYLQIGETRYPLNLKSAIFIDEQIATRLDFHARRYPKLPWQWPKARPPR